MYKTGANFRVSKNVLALHDNPSLPTLLHQLYSNCFQSNMKPDSFLYMALAAAAQASWTFDAACPASVAHPQH